MIFPPTLIHQMTAMASLLRLPLEMVIRYYSRHQLPSVTSKEMKEDVSFCVGTILENLLCFGASDMRYQSVAMDVLNVALIQEIEMVFLVMIIALSSFFELEKII